MSQHGFPCRDRDGPDKGSVLRRSLVKIKIFHVVTKNCSVVTGFNGVMSRRGILCRNREWPRSKDLGCDRVNSVTME